MSSGLRPTQLFRLGQIDRRRPDPAQGFVPRFVEGAPPVPYIPVHAQTGSSAGVLGDDIAGDYSTLAQVRDPDGNLLTLATPPAPPYPPA